MQTRLQLVTSNNAPVRKINEEVLAHCQPQALPSCCFKPVTQLKRKSRWLVLVWHVRETTSGMSDVFSGQCHALGMIRRCRTAKRAVKAGIRSP